MKFRSQRFTRTFENVQKCQHFDIMLNLGFSKGDIMIFEEIHVDAVTGIVGPTGKKFAMEIEAVENYDGLKAGFCLVRFR